MVQETVSKNRVLIVNSSDVPVEDMQKKGAENVKVRYLIDERHGSNRFSLRLYAVQKNGHTPLDQHEYEHQVYVLSGEGKLRGEKENGPVLRTLRAGDTVFLPSNAVHQFVNERGEPFIFLCVKGNPALYRSRPMASEPNTDTHDSARNFC